MRIIKSIIFVITVAILINICYILVTDIIDILLDLLGGSGIRLSREPFYKYDIKSFFY